MNVKKKNVAIAEMIGQPIYIPQTIYGSIGIRTNLCMTREEAESLLEFLKPTTKLKLTIETVNIPFDCDWNWLMKAVQWINDKGYKIDIQIHTNTILIYEAGKPMEDDIVYIQGKDLLSTIFRGVYDFSQYLKPKE